MLNQFVIVGKIVDGITKHNDYMVMTLKTQKSFKNATGEYDYDFIKVYVNDSLNKLIPTTLIDGDMVGIKGRLGQDNDNSILILEKLTYLSSKREE